MKRPSSHALARILVLAALATGTLASTPGCLYVRVRTDMGEGEWLDEVLDDVHETPASFRRGETSLQVRGFLGDLHGRIEMDFACDPDELEDYLEGVGSAIFREVGRRDADVVSMERTGQLGRKFVYRGHDGAGTIELEITEDGAEPGRPYRLEILWDADD